MSFGYLFHSGFNDLWPSFELLELRHEARAVAKEAKASPPPPALAVPAPEEAPEAPEVTAAEPQEIPKEIPQELRPSPPGWISLDHGWLNGWLNGFDSKNSRHVTSFYSVLYSFFPNRSADGLLSLHLCVILGYQRCRDLERGAYHYCC